MTTRWGVLDDPEGRLRNAGRLDGSAAQRHRGSSADAACSHITDEEMRGLSEFLRWADHTDTQGWPPNDAG